MAPAIRRVLESYLRMKQPMAFRTDEWLGQMIGKIRIAAPGSPLHGAQSSLDSLDAINEYSQQFHHGDGTEAVTEIIDTNEFRTCVEQTLRFVEAF